MDCPNDIKPDVDGVLELLKNKKNLALKLVSGSLGVGFYKLTFENDFYYVNTVEISIDELKQLIVNLKGYLVTEYIISHGEIRKIYDITPNTLRILIMRNRNEDPKITGSFMRFGTKKSGVIETAAAALFLQE